MSLQGQGRRWPTGGWHGRSTPSSGNTRAFPHLRFVPIGDIATSPGWLNEYSVSRRETAAAHPWISSLVSRLILVQPPGYEGTDEAQHENAGSRYNDQVN
jgi:hypothetical protein